MNNLLEEIYPFIFQYLNLKEIIKLRFVSKRLKYIVNKQRINELVIDSDPDSIDWSEDRWFNTNKKFDLKYFIKLNLTCENEFKIFENCFLDLDLLINIRFLKLNYNIRNFNCNLTSYHIDKFVKLEQLEFNDDYNDCKNDLLIIKNSNLRSLRIISFSQVKIDCPKLELFVHNFNDNECELVYSNNIKHISYILDLRNFIRFSSDYRNLRLLEYKNLESIEFKFSFIFHLNTILLFKFPKLKLINLEITHYFILENDLIAICNEIQRLFLNRIKFKRDDLVIKFFQEELNNYEQFKARMKRKHPYLNYNMMPI